MKLFKSNHLENSCGSIQYYVVMSYISQKILYPALIHAFYFSTKQYIFVNKKYNYPKAAWPHFELMD